MYLQSHARTRALHTCACFSLLTEKSKATLTFLLVVVDNKLQIESTKVISGRLPMEIGRTNSYGSVPKRRRVSAIRDFPVGCGPSKNIEPVKMAVPGPPDTSTNSRDVEPVKSLEPDMVDVQKDSCNWHVVAPVENVVPQKYSPRYPPRRRITAVRDFPPFCGGTAQHIRESVDVLASAENKNLVEEKSSFKEAVKKTGENVENGDAHHCHLESNVSGFCELNFQADTAVPTTNDIMEDNEVGASSENEMKVKQQQFQESGKTSIEELESNAYLDSAFERVVMQGLMASENGSRLQRDEAHKPCDLASGTNESNWKESDVILKRQHKDSIDLKKNDAENFEGTYVKNKKRVLKKTMIKKRSSLPNAKSHQGIEFVVWETEENHEHEHDGDSDNFQLVRRPRNVDVTLPPSCPSSLSGKGGSNDASVTRNKVREALRLFQVVYRKLVKEDEAKLKHIRRPDCVAANVLRSKGKFVNTNKVIGSVPGVEVGDEFQYRVELHMIGLHRPTQGGIDFVKEGGRVLATSIVASGGYDDDMDDSDVLIYSGSGGNVMKGDKEPEDQKLERGNLALKNSVDAKNPVRVIRGDTTVSESSNSRTRTYVYDGLYLVDKCWQEMGPHGKLVFKFRLVRIPGQPELAWKVVKKSKKCKIREGLCVDDISEGKERIPICAVNPIDDEKPAPFQYTTHVIYPDWCRPIPPRGCDCTNGCSETSKCSCVAKNGGEIPYNHNGAIVEAKPLVYECGPSCKCPPSCYNRVTQFGIKFQLEIFQTESRGWGVRSLNSISSGTFICEYVGELLEEKEAEQRAGNDEYLFDIGSNSSDLWDGLSNLISETHSSPCEDVGESCFTIDAAKYGNVGRFINHSCSPNLYAQNVLYDHEDKRIPHIMLFAAENVPPLQELTYHYNYQIDQVFDSEGNVKKKNCYCGSSECIGRMY